MTLSSLNFSVVSFISLKLYSNLVVMKQMSQQVDYIINQNVLFDNLNNDLKSCNRQV